MTAAFYNSVIDERKMLVSTNMDFATTAPIADKTSCIQCKFEVKGRMEPDARKALLHKFLFALIDAVAGAHHALYAGRMSRGFKRTVYFYADEAGIDPMQAAAKTLLGTPKFGEVELGLSLIPDPDWTMYRTILLPSETDTVEYVESDGVIL